MLPAWGWKATPGFFVSLKITTDKQHSMKKILIANRGEIAVRIMRSAREMGIQTVAVYSDADRGALHVQYADEALLIGPAQSAASYLNIQAIINACKESGADAVHPGYGFLSENPDFADALNAAGITLIGPGADAMRVMGNKLSAKKIALEMGIPLVPGTSDPIENADEAIKAAEQIGFPILIKAAAGGGGKGMRVVKDSDSFTEQLGLAISEAKSAFGDGAVFLERYIEAPRHIEIQILADTKGNTVHLFERECSIQRRHQKVIEEAPSALLTPELRQKMGAHAVSLAQACHYAGAGTVEFIMDEASNFYFLEMNTRLQVEHPVTELITGLDLVKEQIRIAAGESLRITQDDIHIKGHAIELRIYAEDPENNFLPDTGRLSAYILPEGPGVRVDNGYRKDMEIPVFYDPMIAKLCVWGADRQEAIQRMSRAIGEYQISGIKNTLSFGKFVMQHPAFQSGDFDTRFVEIHFLPGSEEESREEEEMVAVLIAEEILNRSGVLPAAQYSQPGKSNWKRNRT